MKRNPVSIWSWAVVSLWLLCATDPAATAAEPNERTWNGLSGSVISVAFSPDSDTLAVAGDYGTVQLWSVGTREGEGRSQGPHARRE